MLTKLTPFILAVLLAATVTAQWNRQSPIPTHLDVRGVGAPTSAHVFIATDDNSFDDGGALFESTDGGSTWTQRNIPQSLSNPLYGIFFLDSQNGWAFGNENYRTTSGGATWTELPPLGSTYFMEFYTPAFGLASGNFDHFVSYDSGTTWVESPNRIVAFDFLDEQTGLGVGDSGLYRTTDGGATFAQVHSGAGSAVTFVSSTSAVAIVDSAFVFSTDGGVTWTVGSSANEKNELKAISSEVVLASGRTGTLPDYDDRVLRSSDGGETWNDLGEVIPEGIDALTVVDPSRVVAAGLAGNMFLSTDAGLTWTQTFSTPGQQPGYLSSAVPVFADSETGYFGYGAGFIIKTTDAGVSWFQISSGTGQTLNDVARFQNGNMIAVGVNGTLLANDGTSRWTIQQSITSSNLTAAQITGAANAVVVDETGRIYQTTNSGSSWTAADSVPEGLTSAKDLHFSSPLDGWVIGQGFSTGSLFRTTDGGSSWTPVTEFLGTYIAVDGEGSNVWAANVSGIFQRSTDNGATWIEGELPDFPPAIQDMEFLNENIGYAAGSWGYVARTTDGGATWTTLSTPNNSDHFTDIHVANANELWLSTTNNRAYYSATGGQSWSALEIQSEGFGTFTSVVASDSGEAWSVGSQGYIEYFAGPPPPPPNMPPVSSFDFLPSGMTVYFTDTSHDPDGSVVSWLWDFGDATFSTEQHPSHTFAVPNTYIVRLTVYDNEGDSGATGRIVVVQPNPGGTFGDFTEVTPIDSVFVTPQDEDFWVITTAPADYDGDGDLDIAVLGYYVVYNKSVEDRLLLLKNNGVSGTGEWDFTHVNVPLGTLTTGSSDMAWGDLDGDGDPDLAVGSDGETVVYRNDAGTLSPLEVSLPAYWEDNGQADFDLRSISWADYDNDGDLDILVPSVFDDSTFEYRTALLRNDGAHGTSGWHFTEVAAGLAATSHAQSLWADFDGDLDLDLLLVNIAPLTDDGFIRRYRNDGGVFVGEDILGPLSVEHGEVQWGDYDSDGDLDVLVVGNVKELDGTYTHMAFRIYRNDAGTHVQQDLLSCIPCGGWFDLTAATWADYDTDGDMDILIAGNYNSGSEIEGRAIIYENVGGVFADSGSVLPAPRASGDRGGTFSWLDMDGEGDLDYFIAGQYFVPGGNGLVEAQMHLYRNDAPGQNAPPSAPAGLSSVVEDTSTVTLSWDPSSDDNTVTAALTYDLNLFRNGIPVSTFKRLPEPGNISAVTQWQLEGLQDGEYQWTIRGVDASYTSGPVAVGSFTLGSVAVKDSSKSIPQSYSLEQNYPNPFNPTTTIDFSVPRSGFVTIALYNILGQEVRSLVKEEKSAGTYRMVLNAEGLPSGTYVYQLRAGSVVQTKKLLLIK